MITQNILYRFIIKNGIVGTFIICLFMASGCSKSGDVAPSTTPPSPSIVISTTPVGGITATSAQCGGNITSNGGFSIIERGLCWSTSPNPTIAGNKSSDGIGNGFYFRKIMGLSLSTTYYVRAFASNVQGTVYGDQLSFTTAASLTAPTAVTTDLVSSVLATTAVCGGLVGLDGGTPITAKGVCWNTSPNPTIANSKSMDGPGEGTFTSNLTGLSENTIYYIRAYGSNSVGTTYGPEFSFKTYQAGTVYIGGFNNKFYALNALTGQVKWTYTGTAAFNAVGPCYANGKIYVGSQDSYMYCLDTLNGNMIWRFQAGNLGLESDPVYDNGTVYFGSVDDYLYAVDANTGTMKWRYLTGGNVSTSPVVNNGIVYFGSSDGKVYAVNASTGLSVWSYNTGGLISVGGPALANGVLYIGNRAGYLYALDMNTGAFLWSYSVNNVSLEHCSPTVSNNMVYITGGADVFGGSGRKGSVYAINATTGQLVWEKYQNTGFYSSAQVENGKLYLTGQGELIALSSVDGTTLWERNQMAPNGASPVILNDLLYVGSGGSNYIYAIDANTAAGEKWKFPISNSAMTSNACVVTATSVKYSAKSGMQQ